MSDQTWTKAKRSEISRNEKVQHFFSIWSYLSEPAARHAMQRGSYWTVECRQAMFFSENGTKRSNFSALCPAMGVPLLLLIHFVQSFCENPTSSPPAKGQWLANLMLQIQQKSNKNQSPYADQLPAWADNIWKARGQSWIQVLEGMDLVPFRIPGITRKNTLNLSKSWKSGSFGGFDGCGQCYYLGYFELKHAVSTTTSHLKHQTYKHNQILHCCLKSKASSLHESLSGLLANGSQYSTTGDYIVALSSGSCI